MAKEIELDEDKRSTLQIVGSAVLRCGPMPKHVAFIMDGNRRYARKLGQEAIKGHEKGELVLREVISWALALHIPVITVYAFSIENFKRSPEEIDKIFSLCQKVIDMLLSPTNNYLQDKGVRAQVIGNWDLIPEQMKPAIGKLNLHARERPDSVLTVNIAMAYTSRDAIYRSYNAIVEGSGFLSPSDVNERLFEELHSPVPLPPVDLLIRTGGDTRLSDFMLWESTYAHLEFLEVTWPEFMFWDFWKAIIRYQSTPRMQDPQKDQTLTKKQIEFISIHRDKIWKEMELVAARFQEPEKEETIALKRNWFKTAFMNLLDF